MKVELNKIASLALCLPMLCFAVSGSMASEVAEREGYRLALLDKTSEKVESRKYSDLLFRALLLQDRIELIERQDVESIIREQSLQLALSDSVDSSYVLKCGHLIGADAILLCEAEESDDGAEFLRVRLLNAVHGFKLFDRLLSMGGSADEVELTLTRLAKHVKQQLDRCNVAVSDLHAVSVSSFRSEELAPRWNWLGGSIPSAIERRLLLRKGVVLMERHEVTSLLDERDISRDLPKAISSAALLVSGSYRIDHSKSEVTIDTLIRRGEQIIAKSSVRGLLDDHEKLCADIVDDLTKMMSEAGLQILMNPKEESAMLADEARAHLQRRENELAVAPAESAYALLPQSLEYLKLLLHAKSAAGLRSHKDVMHILNLAQKLARNEPYAPQGSRESQQRSFPESAALNACNNYLVRVDDKSSTAQIEAVEAYLDLCRLCCGKYGKKSKAKLQGILFHASSAIMFTSSVDTGLRVFDWVLGEQIENELEPNVLYKLSESARMLPAEARKKIENKLATLRETEEPSLKLRFLDESIRFYQVTGGEPARMRAMSEEYLDLSMKLKMLNPLRIAYVKYSPYEDKSELYEAKYLLRLLEFAHSEGLVRCNTDAWDKAAARLSEILEKIGRIKDALDCLETMRQVYERQLKVPRSHLREKIAELKRRHPDVDFDDNSMRVTKCMARVILSNDAIPLGADDREKPSFLKLIICKGVPTVLCSVRDSYAILRLKGKGPAGIEMQQHPSALGFDARIAELRDYWKSEGVCLAARNDDVFAGFSGAGILVFRADGTTEHLSEESGLAYDRIRFMDVLEDKLYAIAGTHFEEGGLMEIDLANMNSRFLSSSKMTGGNESLNKSGLHGIASDPERKTLWICADALYSYNPETSVFQRYENEATSEFAKSVGYFGTAKALRLYHGDLLVSARWGVYRYDLKTEKGRMLLKRGNFKRLTAEWHYPGDTIMPPYTLLGDGVLLCTVYGQLAIFKKGSADPKMITNDSFPGMTKEDTLDARDLVVTDEGIYVLTPTSLYFIPKNAELLQ